MDELKQKIDDSRNLKPKSLTQYMTHIKRLYKEVADSKGDILESLADEDKVMDFLKKTFQDATIRSYLASVIVALSTDKDEYKKELEIYNDILVDMNEDYKKLMKDGTRTDKQKKNWANWEDILKIQQEKKEKADKVFEMPLKRQRTNWKTIQDYVIASLYTLQPPVRLDYADTLVVHSDATKKPNDFNYLEVKKDGMRFIFNRYKTDKKYGTVIKDVPKDLEEVLRKWLKVNNSGDFLLTQNNQDLMSDNALSKNISRIFSHDGKKLNVNLLRNIFLTHELGSQTKEQQLAKDMMNSTDAQKIYRKDTDK